jgi:hypothetical protein
MCINADGFQKPDQQIQSPVNVAHGIDTATCLTKAWRERLSSSVKPFHAQKLRAGFLVGYPARSTLRNRRHRNKRHSTPAAANAYKWLRERKGVLRRSYARSDAAAG